MSLDRNTSTQLRRFATVFKEARERNANESDTVMYLVKMFEDVFGFDSLRGEISKEVAIKNRFCDLAIKLDGGVVFLVEAKAAGQKGLVDKNIEQAESYASHKGVQWVLLTNGVEWRLFHLTFAENEGIAHDVAFSANLIDDLEKDSEALWAKLSLLTKASIRKRELDAFWSQKKVLSPASVVKILFSEVALTVIRRELNRDAPARLDMQDVFNAIRDVLSKEALAEAGDLGIRKRRRRRKRVQRKDPVTGQVTEQEIEVDDDAQAGEESGAVVVDATVEAGGEQRTGN